MIQFNDRPIKREVQHLLFTTVNKKGVHITGLAGNCPEEYKKILKLHFAYNKISLVDFELKGEGILNMPISKAPSTLFMDCDFCDTVINSGEELLAVKYNMSEKYKGKRKVLSFTFSNRMSGGITRTIEWLNNNLYNNSLELNGLDISKSVAQHNYWRVIGHSQNKFEKSVLVSYRDTCSMLSGIISWV